MERIENGKLIWSINGTVVGGAGMVAGKWVLHSTSTALINMLILAIRATRVFGPSACVLIDG